MLIRAATSPMGQIFLGFYSIDNQLCSWGDGGGKNKLGFDSACPNLCSWGRCLKNKFGFGFNYSHLCSHYISELDAFICHLACGPAHGFLGGRGWKKKSGFDLTCPNLCSWGAVLEKQFRVWLELLPPLFLGGGKGVYRAMAG